MTHVNFRNGRAGFLAVVAAFFVASNPVHAALIAYWAADGNTNDSSGNALNGTWVSTPAYGAGPTGFGQAFSLDGTSSLVVDIPGTPATWFAGNPSITVSAWLNPDSIGTTQVFLGIATGWQVYLNESGQIIANGIGSGATTVPANDWTFFTEVIDFTNSVHQLYIDGTLVATGAYVAPSAGLLDSAWGIGDYGTNSVPYSIPFIGLIDDIRVYNTALTQPEIAELMVPVPEPSTTALVALVGVGFLAQRRRASARK